MPHTPGPWFVFPNGHCVGGPTGLIDGDPREKTAGIALCGMRLRTEEEAKANACLIAAAPDLLAACEQILNSTCPSETGAAMKTVQAAIVKARGLAVG